MQTRITISFDKCLDLFDRNDDVREWCEENDVRRPRWSTPPDTIEDVMTAVFPNEQQAAAFKLRWL